MCWTGRYKHDARVKCCTLPPSQLLDVNPELTRSRMDSDFAEQLYEAYVWPHSWMQINAHAHLAYFLQHCLFGYQLWYSGCVSNTLKREKISAETYSITSVGGLRVYHHFRPGSGYRLAEKIHIDVGSPDRCTMEYGRGNNHQQHNSINGLGAFRSSKHINFSPNDSDCYPGVSVYRSTTLHPTQYVIDATLWKGLRMSSVGSVMAAAHVSLL